MAITAVRSKLWTGSLLLLVWHILMNTGVFMEGWYGDGFNGWITSQITGIPFYIDHAVKYAVLLGIYEISKPVIDRCLASYRKP